VVIEEQALAESDLDEVVDLERTCFPDAWSREAFEDEVDRAAHGGYSRVARIGGELAGYLISWFIYDEAHLANLAVDPRWRRQGVGRTMLQDFLREARLRGCSVAHLEVRATNDGAIDLYRAHGFQPVSVRKNYYQREHEDALVMACFLRREEE